MESNKTCSLVAHAWCVTRDVKNKLRQVDIQLQKWPERYEIHRSSGLVNGKNIMGPIVTITAGKAKRTLEEQAMLQYNAMVKEYLDKGYKDAIKLKTDFPDKSLEELFPTIKTDTNGAKKVMLCKVIDFEDKKLLDTQWLTSHKIDGVRCTIFMRNGKIVTASRGGQDYDIPTTYIREDPTVKKILQENPDIILDGELYRHGWPLEKISGLCRQITLCEEHKELKFHCYDIMDELQSFKDRYTKQLSFNVPVDSKLVIVEQISIGPFTDLKEFKKKAMELHDYFVKEGYEGAVIKNADEVYKCGARDRRCQKIKIFKDGEFKVTGLSEGLREEDMAFELVTAEGYPFKAKPEGDRALKHWYHEHIDELIGKMATVRYFHMSNTEHPVPNLPVLVAFRLNQDLDINE